MSACSEETGSRSQVCAYGSRRFPQWLNVFCSSQRRACCGRHGVLLEGTGSLPSSHPGTALMRSVVPGGYGKTNIGGCCCCWEENGLLGKKKRKRKSGGSKEMRVAMEIGGALYPALAEDPHVRPPHLLQPHRYNLWPDTTMSPCSVSLCAAGNSLLTPMTVHGTSPGTSLLVTAILPQNSPF